ncbi:hypothetical protein Cni_G28231 [Canna indica]|uniref:WW domain-containing protein n=1 Tax=Canna indica TaxID=4628 RepID=A0AAQ3L6B3_9LILI|nr:hypothetical protein Cni_G28231 [Canna indica]
MGKRKERRIAAMMAASRRVKLDLFTEPSGEMVSSSLHDEVGGDLDKECPAGAPISPSSSGKKQENPLSLLEQYSDDELDEEASAQPIQNNEESLSTAPEEQVQENVDVDVGVVVGSKTDNADAADDIKDDNQLDNLKNLESNDSKEGDMALSASQYSEADLANQPIHDASRMQIVGDLPGSWKVVMHEQSNQYYYWNTVTGETSWEVPPGLTPEVLSNGAIISSSAEGHVNYPVVLQANVPATDMHGINNLVPGSIEAYGAVQMAKGDVNIQSGNTLLDYSRPSGEDLSSYEAKHDTAATECYTMTDDLSTQLIKYGQTLLQRLEALKGSLEGHEWNVKQIQLRISDCEALSSYGSSLLPFWWHTETKLKQIESVIFKAEVSSMADKSNSENLAASAVVEKKSNLANGEMTVVQAELDNKMLDSGYTENKGFPVGSASNDIIIDKDEQVVHSVSKVELPAEDVDMDVEMEVDDETVTTSSPHLTAECPVPVEPVVQTNPSSVVSPSDPLGQPDIPPPPDEEWIPPPPPDSELIPPPPPEDPPEPSYPPPLYADAMPPPFQDQYSLGYALPSYEYYATTGSEVTSLNYYVQADGSQLAEPPQASYYEPVVSSSYAEVATHVNPVEPMTYYNISGGSLPHAPVVTGTTSSAFYVESGPVSYNNSLPVLDHASSVVYNAEPVNKSVPPVEHDSDVSAIVKEPDKGSLETSSNVSTKKFAGAAFVNGTVAVAPPALNKNKSKVSRSKKSTIAVAASLRSNKKVSSLVDKWKAAKEELHGEEEEEPKDALEILEKKRQKEIEEWRARQIATGEAQDNANFLPLGGDWRERVKRRRAEAKTDASQTVSMAAYNEKKQPDLVELSKDLPSGWQAYWDESSKEVYYGNSITSETTWSRPTR